MTLTIGIIAGILTTAAFVPQVWRTWRTKSAEDLSLPMLVMFLLGISGWLVYGIRLREPPIIVSNLVTIVLTLLLIVGKIRFGRPIAKSPNPPISKSPNPQISK